MPSNHEDTETAMETEEDPVEIEKLAAGKKTEGNTFYSKKEYDEAIRLYSEAIELCPNVAGYYGNRSAANMMAKKYKAALNDAQMSTKLDNHFAKGYFREGKCHIALGNSAAALLSLQKAKDMDPKNHSIMTEVRQAQHLDEFEQQAIASSTKKDYRQVVYCMDRCSQISPACIRYKVMKAEFLALLGRFDEAQSLSQDVLRMDRMNAEAVYVRAICYYYDDNIEKAQNFFIHALKLSPDLTKARDSLRKAKQLAAKKEEGNAAFKVGKLNEAYELYAEALKIDENNRKTNAKLRCNKALVAQKMKKYEEAIQDASIAIELDEKYLKAYLRRAQCYKLNEQFEEAVRDYKRVFDMERTREHKQLLKEAEHELKLSQRKDYYKILGVSRNAADAEIKKAYRKQALLHHPDRHSHDTPEVQKESEKKFKEVGEAYAILSDPKKKDRFDRGEDIDGPSMGDFDAGNIFQMFFGGGGGGGTPFQHFSDGGGGRQQEYHFSF